MAFKHGNNTIVDLNSNETEIRSPSNLVLYPTDNIWISQGTKLIFEGTIPDNYEAKLQANAVTADRDIILPDESGTLATQAYVTSAVSSGSISDTDALAEGSTNLYYTDTRFDTRLATKSTTDVSEGTNLYYTDARVDARIASNTGGSLDLSGKTTSDLAEGTNLYYTDARADTRATLRITAADIGNLNNVSGTAPSNGDFLLYDSGASEFAPVAFATEVNSYADARIALASIQDLSDVDGSDTPANGDTLVYDGTDFGFVNLNSETNSLFDIRFATKSTTDLAEGTNLYYTDARADARITNALGGNVTIGGNLTVSGTTTTVNSNTVNIGDSIITLNSDETGAPSQNGGIEIERGTSTNVQLRFNETSDAWEFTNDGTTYVALGTASNFSGNTDGVTEGSTNLYYTDARFDTRLGTKSTTDLAEGTNLYFTNARSRSAISVAGDLSYNSSTGVISFTETAQDFAYSSLTGAPTNVSTFTNDSGYITGYTVTSGDVTGALGFTPYNATNPDGYITGYTVTQGDVTAHQAALSITQSQISDLDHYTDADVDAHLSGGTGVNYASGVISIGQGVSTSSHVEFHCIGVGTPASTTQGEIRATADITAYYSSDANLKENVINITNALEKVQQIRGVEFDWKQEYIDARGGEDDYFIRKHDVGVIAQEVEAVLPEVVGTRTDGTKAVKYDRITSLLIEAIKEQQSQIDQLKAIVEELKNK